MSHGMTRARTAWIAVLVAAMVVPAVAAPARAARKAPPVRGRLVIPAPGHITIQAFTMTVKHPTSRQRRNGLLKPSLPTAGKLPPSVRILYVRRTVKKKNSLTTGMLVLVLNHAAPAQARSVRAPVAAAAEADDPCAPEADESDVAGRLLRFFASGGITEELRNIRVAVHEKECLYRMRGSINADQAKPGEEQRSAEVPIMDFLKVSARLSDPDVETGHYDDGHAFSWNVNSRADQLDIWKTLVNDDLSQLVSDIEEKIGTDLDADGVIGNGQGGGGGGSNPCTGKATTDSQPVAGPPNSADYGYTTFSTVIPSSCKTVSGEPEYSAYLINDADGSLLACHVGELGPIAGQPDCPEGNYGATINGDELNPPAFYDVNSGASWRLVVAAYGRNRTAQLVDSAHLVYSFQGSN